MDDKISNNSYHKVKSAISWSGYWYWTDVPEQNQQQSVGALDNHHWLVYARNSEKKTN